MAADPDFGNFDPISHTLEDILTVVGNTQEESKQKSAELQQLMVQAMFIDLMAKAPEQTQNTLIEESKKNPTREKTVKLFRKYYQPEEIMASFQAATYVIMQKYFEEVSPHLSDEQKKRIANIIQKHYSDLTKK